MLNIKRLMQNIFSLKSDYKHKIITVLGIKFKIRHALKSNVLNVLQGKKTPSPEGNKIHYQTIHYVIAMLKAYGIKYIVASPGSQNAFFNLSVQNDKDFECFSVIDERSAGYVAIGIANEAKQPVVITCTGATASRNYLSALTEAFYNNIPIIALTFQPYTYNQFDIIPQFVDRTISQNDIKSVSVHLPQINSESDKKLCLTYLNATLSEALYKKMPVHINCPSFHNWKFLDNIKTLPNDIWTTKYYFTDFEHVKSELFSKNIAVFIGAHKIFSAIEEKSLSDFATSWNAPVFCDHTASYKGKNKILISQACFMRNLDVIPDIVIDIGGICGDYSSNRLLANAEIWRVDSTGLYKQRNQYPVSKIFACDENLFFELLKNTNTQHSNYFEYVLSNILKNEIPDMPLCVYYIARHLSNNIPNNSSLHLGILSSLRSINCFNIDNSIDVTSNVGGFGIDGALSTTIGQSLVNPNKKCFCMLGDLAFFYDINSLGIKHIKNNLRILLINNNRGSEFSMGGLYRPIIKQNGDLVAAANHYKGNPAKSWVESLGFKYMSANSKEDFCSKIKDFCSKDYNSPLLFEVFTTDEDEIKGFDLMYEYNRKNTLKG